MSMDKEVKKKSWIRQHLVLLASVLTVTAGAVIAHQASGSGALRVPRENMTLAAVKEDSFVEYIPVIGSVIPEKTLLLTAMEGGRVEQIFIEAGTLVRPGDKILQFSNTNLLLDIMYREAEFYRQSNSLRDTRLMFEQNTIQMQQQMAEIEHLRQVAQKQYERQKELYGAQIVSRKDYEEAESQFRYLRDKEALVRASMDRDSALRTEQIKQLELSLKRMGDNLAIVKQKQEELTLRSPISGLLSALDAEQGETKGPGAPIGQIDDLQGFKVRAEIDEHYISQVEPGREGNLDYLGTIALLKITKIYPEVIQGRFRVDLEFVQAAPRDIRRGQTLHLKLELGCRKKALLLTRGDFFQTTGGHWAYVLSKDGKRAEKRTIKLGRQNTDQYEVLSGLRAGDQVIVSSYDPFHDASSLILQQ